jgi:hypothetical protein
MLTLSAQSLLAVVGSTVLHESDLPKILLVNENGFFGQKMRLNTGMGPSLSHQKNKSNLEFPYQGMPCN